jgi:hypothetical protein
MDNENIPHHNMHQNLHHDENENADLKEILSHIGLLFLNRDYSISLDKSTIPEFINECKLFQTALQNRDEEMRNVINGLAGEKERLCGVVIELGERLERGERDMKEVISNGVRGRDEEIAGLNSELKELRNESLGHEAAVANLKTGYAEKVQNMEKRIERMGKEEERNEEMVKGLNSSQGNRMMDAEREIDALRLKVGNYESTFSGLRKDSSQEILRLEGEVSALNTRSRLDLGIVSTF